MRQEMNPFVARLIFRIKMGTTGSAHSYEEQLRMVYAADSSDAYHKAGMLGLEEETELPQDLHGKVRWEFAGITELRRLPEIGHGLELDSVIREPEDVPAFESYIGEKIHSLKQQVPVKGMLNLSSLASPWFQAGF